MSLAGRIHRASVSIGRAGGEGAVFALHLSRWTAALLSEELTLEHAVDVRHGSQVFGHRVVIDDTLPLHHMLLRLEVVA